MSIFNMGGGTTGAPPPIRGRRIDAGTPQQEALWGRLVEGEGHILAEARAGCGKSSSCREGMHRMLAHKRRRIRYAVFNTANAQEFKADCPPGVDVGTIHSFGNAALRATFKSRIEKNKTYIILDGIPEGAKLPRWCRKAINQLVGHGKNQMLRPDDPQLTLRLLDLATRFDVRTYRETDACCNIAALALKRSAEMTDLADFDDMLWLPAIVGLPFPAIDVLFVDEAQDLCPSQHALMPLIAGDGRMVLVGDSRQAIYAFRGADSDSIPTMQRYLGAQPRGLEQLPLTVTFRCPKSHVALANQYVPDLRAHESNADGVIEEDVPLGAALERIGPGDMLICPTNAPTIAAALNLLKQRRPCQVKGRAVGDQLLDVIREAGNPDSIAALCAGVDRWRGKEIDRLSQREGVEDQVESVNDRAAGVQALAAGCENTAEIPGLVSKLFTDTLSDQAIKLSTVHRAKGLEATNVYFLDIPGRAPRRAWEEQQQRNLRYVALTRSKNRLTFVVDEEAEKKRGAVASQDAAWDKDLGI